MKQQLSKSDRISEYTDRAVVDELIAKTDMAVQPEFYKMPYKFKSVPVDKLPHGCDKDKQYYKIYPRATLPFQIATKIKFGHTDLPPNRLIWGDNLHVMRMLKSELIDVVYIDPPFFSGKNYNVIFGDQNEVRSFSDIWEGGMHSYLIWLNARLLEIKRLLKPTGSLFVHLDHHASHYVKIELDKIFGYENFVNEIVWYYPGGLKKISKHFPRKHDVILFYKKTNDKNRVFNPQRKEATTDVEFWRRWGKRSSDGKNIRLKDIPVTDKINRERQIKKFRNQNGRMPKPDDIIYTLEGQLVESVWDDCSSVYRKSENIGYPTQKPESLLERIICSTTNEGDVVADFFVGGGGHPQ